MAYQTSQGLASLGRNGDTMLMHVNPTEVAGLQSLAMSQGGSLTINPQTGLPEAFNLGGFFSSFLPTIAGMAFGGPGGAAMMQGIAAGAITGAGLAAVKGEDVLMGGLTGGLGGYGGGQMGPAFGAASGVNAPVKALEGTLPNIGGAGAADAIGTNVLQQTPLYQGGLRMVAPSSLPEINAQGIITQAGQGAGSSFSGAIAFNPMEMLSDSFSGMKNVAGLGDMSQADAFKAFKGAGGSGTQLGMTGAGALLGGLEPSDIYGKPINMDEAKKKQAYNPYATLNLSGDTGLRLYATGGTVQSGGIRDLYGTPDNQPTISPGLSGFGLGRLNNLAGEQAMTQAQTLGYAMGGPVSFADGGDSNKEDALGLPSLSPDMSMDPNAGAGNSAMLQSAIGAMQPMQGMQGSSSMAQGQMPDQSNDSLIAKVTANLRADPNYQPTNPIEAAIAKQIKGTDPMQQGQPSQQGLGSLTPNQPSFPTAATYNPSVAMGPTYFAGMNAPKGMARGGYLNGQGDGMSDSIPATIEGKQPARLADGEFVVPADVVSHIGNGSSKAGSKRLYAMLDKVRHARTGNKKQGKQINPNKYMPA